MEVSHITTLFEEYGSPLYVYNAEQIRTRVQQLQTDLTQYAHTDFLYAIKANYNPHIVRIITDMGIGIDAVSVEEVELALHIGVPASRIMFTGNNMTDSEMHRVHDLGVLLNIGSLSRLKKYGVAYPGSRVCVRFNPNIGIASHETNITGGADSKFGISFKSVEAVQEIATEYNLQIVGIHQHIGSGWLRTREPLLALDVILDIAAQIPDLEFIDVGGGFGIPYHRDDAPLDTKFLGARIKERMQEFTEAYGTEVTLRFEPGRYFVAESGTLYTEVNTIKETISRRTVIGTNTGMNHLVRPAMYGSYHPIENVSNPNGERKEYDITGNICECADYFGRDFLLSEVREGDILAIGCAGAYGMSMASNYQFRMLPAEVLIDGDVVRCIRPRQQFAELLAVYGELT